MTTVGMNIDMDFTQKEFSKFRRQLLGAVIISGLTGRSSLFTPDNKSDREVVKKWIEFLEETYNG